MEYITAPKYITFLFKGMNYWYSKHEWLSKHYISERSQTQDYMWLYLYEELEKSKGRLIGWSLWKEMDCKKLS